MKKAILYLSVFFVAASFGFSAPLTEDVTFPVVAPSTGDVTLPEGAPSTADAAFPADTPQTADSHLKESPAPSTGAATPPQNSLPPQDPLLKESIPLPENSLAQELSPRDIISLALEYSLCPVDSEEGQHSLKKYDYLEKSAAKQFGNLKKSESAEKLLLFLHDGALFTYQEDAVKMNQTLLTGEYNCVTASLLYLALAKSLQIETALQETELHAYCTVYLEGQKIDVETTNPYGFNPGQKKLVAQTQNSRKYAVIPKKYYSGKRQVSDLAAATLPGKNLAAMFNDTSQYEKALPLEISRLKLLEHHSDPEAKTARNELDILACNRAIALNRLSQPEEAMDFLEKVAKMFGNTPSLQKTYGNSLYNACVNLLNENLETQAQELFEKRRYLAHQTMQTCIKNMIDSQIKKKHEITVHNQVVPLFNSGEYAQAQKILQTALEQNPTSTLLKKDLQAVKKALGQ